MTDSYYDSQSFGTDQELRLAKAKHVTRTIQTLFYQFLFTFGCVLVCTHIDVVHTIVRNNHQGLLISGALGSVGALINMKTSKYKPMELLPSFTFCATTVVCSWTVMHGRDAMMMAMLVSIGIAAGLGVYARITSNGRYKLIGPLLSGLSCLLTMGCINMFFNIPFLHTFELYGGTLMFLEYVVLMFNAV